MFRNELPKTDSSHPFSDALEGMAIGERAKLAEINESLARVAVPVWRKAASDALENFGQLLGRESSQSDFAELEGLSQLLTGESGDDESIRTAIIDFLSHPSAYFDIARVSAMLAYLGSLNRKDRLAKVKEILVWTDVLPDDKVMGVGKNKTITKLNAALVGASGLIKSGVTRNMEAVAVIQSRIASGGYDYLLRFLSLPYIAAGREVMLRSFVKMLEAETEAKSSAAMMDESEREYRKLLIRTAQEAKTDRGELETYNADKITMVAAIDMFDSLTFVAESGALKSTEHRAELMSEFLIQIGITEKGFKEHLKRRDRVDNEQPKANRRRANMLATEYYQLRGVHDMTAAIRARSESWFDAGLYAVKTVAALHVTLTTIANHLVTTRNDVQIESMRDDIKRMLELISTGDYIKAIAYGQRNDLIPQGKSSTPGGAVELS